MSPFGRSSLPPKWVTSFMDGSLRQSLVSRDVKCVSKKIKAVDGKISIQAQFFFEGRA